MAQNSAGCVSAPFTSVISTQPVTPPAPALTVMQPTCTLGTGTISVASPVDSFTYSISNVNYPSGSSFAGLVTGPYTVTARNSEGCISPATAATVVAPPAAPAAPVVTVSQPTCTVATGTISISGGGDSLSYSLNNGGWQTGNVFSDVAAGSYHVAAENSGGCVSSPSIAVILPAPAAPPAPEVTIVQPTCSLTTGSIAVTGSSGAGLLYSINDTSYQPETSFINLLPGSYPVTVRDGTGCVSSADVAIISPMPASCSIVISVYPNPYAGEVNFTIISPETGKGLLVFYNLLGDRMNGAIEQDFTAGMPTSINCPMGFAHGQAVVYQFMIGKKKWQGTLLPLKF